MVSYNIVVGFGSVELLDQMIPRVPFPDDGPVTESRPRLDLGNLDRLELTLADVSGVSSGCDGVRLRYHLIDDHEHIAVGEHLDVMVL